MNEIVDKLNNQWIFKYSPKSWFQIFHCRHSVMKLRTTKNSPSQIKSLNYREYCHKNCIKNKRGKLYLRKISQQDTHRFFYYKNNFIRMLNRRFGLIFKTERVEIERVRQKKSYSPLLISDFCVQPNNCVEVVLRYVVVGVVTIKI